MRVRFRATALDDVASIYLFRSTEHSPTVAMNVESAIFATTELLARHPELGIETDHKAGVRRWPMTQYDYASFYRISKESLDILRVLDSKVVRDRHRVPGSGSDED